MVRESMPELLGARELSAQLSALGAGVGGPTLKKAVKDAMLPVFRRALETIPIGGGARPSHTPLELPIKEKHRTYTGRLVEPGFAQSHLQLKVWQSKDKQAAAAMVGVSPEAFYVLQFIELGTSKQAPAPWLEPAFRAEAGTVGALVADSLRKRIERIARARAKPGYKPGSIRPPKAGRAA